MLKSRFLIIIFFAAIIAAIAIIRPMFTSADASPGLEEEIIAVLNDMGKTVEVGYDEISISPDKRSAIIKNLEMTKSGVRNKIARLTLEEPGKNALYGKVKKPMPLARRIVFGDFTLSDGRSVISGKEYTLEDVTGEVALFELLLPKDSQSSIFAQTPSASGALDKILSDALKALSFSLAYGHEITISEGSAPVCEIEYLDIKKARQGYADSLSLRGVNIYDQSWKMLSVAKMSTNELDLTGLIALHTIQAKLAKVKKNPLRISNLVVSDVKIFPEQNEPDTFINMRQAKIDIKMFIKDDPGDICKLAIDNITFDKNLPAVLSSLPVQSITRDKFDFSLIADISGTSNTVKIEKLSITENKLLSIDCVLHMNGITADSIVSANPLAALGAALEKFEFKLTDSGAVDFILDLTAALGVKGQTRESVRGDVLSFLEMHMARGKTKTGQDVLAKLSELVAKSGTLSVAVNPEQPVRIGVIVFNPDVLDVVVEHIPARD
jgi:hypothetical protein